MDISAEAAVSSASAAALGAAAAAAAHGTASARAWSMTAGTGPHVVLNNGHAIKHLATHRGHATAGDGVRLFFEVFESHRALPAVAKSGDSAPEPTALYEVRAIAGSGPEDMGPAATAFAIGGALGSETGGVASPPAYGAASSATPRPSSVPAAVAATLFFPDTEAEPLAAAGDAAAAQRATVTASPTRGSGGGAVATALPTTEGDDAVGRSHQSPGVSSCTESGKCATADPVGTWDAAADVANVLLIMGFAAGRHGWLPLIQHWMEEAGSEPLHRLRARFCVFDNRGIGDSGSPPHTGSYSTSIMARDALAVMDHLGWRQAHVVGFSMGGMIAHRLALAAPQRLLSLTVLSVTNGGWQVIPTRWRALKLLLWAATARTPRARAHADVHFHFSRETLHAEVPAPRGAAGANGAADGGAAAAQAQRVESALIDEYVSTSLDCAPQPHTGLMGQLHAVWTHGLSAHEQHSLRQLAVPHKVIHGYHDVMAMPVYGERIAKHTRAVFIMLDGGHFVARECAPQVCMHIADSVASARKLK